MLESGTGYGGSATGGGDQPWRGVHEVGTDAQPRSGCRRILERGRLLGVRVQIDDNRPPAGTQPVLDRGGDSIGVTTQIRVDQFHPKAANARSAPTRSPRSVCSRSPVEEPSANPSSARPPSEPGSQTPAPRNGHARRTRRDHLRSERPRLLHRQRPQPCSRSARNRPG